MYAQCIVQLADAAVRYLEMGQALKAHGALNLSPDVNEYDDAHFEVTIDLALRIFFWHIIYTGILWYKHSRPAEQYPRATVGTPYGYF